MYINIIYTVLIIYASVLLLKYGIKEGYILIYIAVFYTAVLFSKFAIKRIMKYAAKRSLKKLQIKNNQAEKQTSHKTNIFDDKFINTNTSDYIQYDSETNNENNNLICFFTKESKKINTDEDIYIYTLQHSYKYKDKIINKNVKYNAYNACIEYFLPDKVETVLYYYNNTEIIYVFQLNGFEFKWHYNGDANFIIVNKGASIRLQLLEKFLDKYSSIPLNIYENNRKHLYMQNAYTKSYESLYENTDIKSYLYKQCSSSRQIPHIICLKKTNIQNSAKNSRLALSMLGITCWNMEEIFTTVNSKIYIIKVEPESYKEYDSGNNTLSAFYSSPVFLVYTNTEDLHSIQIEIQNELAHCKNICNIKPFILPFNSDGVIISYGISYLYRMESYNKEFHFFNGSIYQLVHYIPLFIKKYSIKNIVLCYAEKSISEANNAVYRNDILDNFSWDLADFIESDYTHTFNTVIEYKAVNQTLQILFMKNLFIYDNTENENIYFMEMYSSLVKSMSNIYGSGDIICMENTHSIVLFSTDNT